MSLDDLLSVPLTATSYLSCLAASIILASITLLERKKYISILLMIILDIWMLANIIYSEANNIWIDWQVIVNANQIKGFEDSILSYLSWSYVTFPLITIITIYLLSIFHTQTDKSWMRLWKTYLIVFCGALVLYAFSWSIRALSMDKTMTPIRKEKLIIKTHSPVMHLLIVGKEAMIEDILKRIGEEDG